MMDAKMEIAPEAIVTKVTKHPIVEVAEGVQVRRFTVYAQMYLPAHKYSTDLYLVKIVEPVALQYLQPEQGWLMEHGEFQFDAVDDVPIDTRLISKSRRGLCLSLSGGRDRR